MPSNPNDEFVWISIDRSCHHEQLLQQSKEKMVSLSFENDVHPLGTKHSLSSSLVTKMSAKDLKNSLAKSKRELFTESTKLEKTTA